MGEAQISESLHLDGVCGREEIKGHGVHEMLHSPLTEATSDERSWSGKGRVFVAKLISTTSLGAVLAKSRASTPVFITC